MSVFTKEDLKIFQSEPLDQKIQRSLAKVSEWFSRWDSNVYVSLSGGKDPDQMRIDDFGIDCEWSEPLRTTGCDRTGCIFCGFGCHGRTIDSVPRFVRLKKTHPRQYEYCIGGGEYDENGVWMPNKQGLGMGHVFDELNKIYGDDFIKY